MQDLFTQALGINSPWFIKDSQEKLRFSCLRTLSILKTSLTTSPWGSKKAQPFPFLISCKNRFFKSVVFPVPVLPRTKVWSSRSDGFIPKIWFWLRKLVLPMYEMFLFNQSMNWLYGYFGKLAGVFVWLLEWVNLKCIYTTLCYYFRTCLKQEISWSFTIPIDCI
jgi:hypothetical protein